MFPHGFERTIEISALLIRAIPGVCWSCVSVFFGTELELSLYDVHELSSHRIPRASLLSRNEDPKANETAQDSAEGSAIEDLWGRRRF